MAQVNHGIGDVVSTEKIGIFALKAYQQRTKLIDPGKTALVREAMLVNGRVEQAFPSAFRLLAIARVFSDVGDEPMVEAHLAGSFGVEGTVGVKVSTGDGQAQALDELESRLQMRLEVISVMMVASDNARRSDDVAVAFGDGQDIGGFSAFARLIGNAFAALLGNRVAAIQVEFRQIQPLLDRHDAVLPNSLQAPIAAPLAEVIVDGIPTDFFFVGSAGSAAMGNCAH